MKFKIQYIYNISDFIFNSIKSNFFNKMTPLNFAIEEQEAKIVQILLSDSRIDITIKSI